MNEVWKPVPGHEGYYAVSNLGRIMRTSGGKGATSGRIITPIIGTTGYPTIRMSKFDIKTTIYIHRLVALAFLGPAPFEGATVNHKDGVKTNNSPGNLEWVSLADNIRHSFRTGLWAPGNQSGEHNGNAKLTRELVAQIRSLKGTASHRSLAKRFGVTKTTISDILSGKKWPEGKPPSSSEGRPWRRARVLEVPDG